MEGNTEKFDRLLQQIMGKHKVSKPSDGYTTTSSTQHQLSVVCPKVSKPSNVCATTSSTQHQPSVVYTKTSRSDGDSKSCKRNCYICGETFASAGNTFFSHIRNHWMPTSSSSSFKTATTTSTTKDGGSSTYFLDSEESSKICRLDQIYSSSGNTYSIFAKSYPRSLVAIKKQESIPKTEVTSERLDKGKRLKDAETVDTSNKKQKMHDHNNFKCDICNKCFSSHQALGGHKSSHNRHSSGVQQTPSRDKELITKAARKSNFNSKKNQYKICKRLFRTGPALGENMKLFDWVEHPLLAPTSITSLSIASPVQTPTSTIDLSIAPSAEEPTSINNLITSASQEQTRSRTISTGRGFNFDLNDPNAEIEEENVGTEH